MDTMDTLQLMFSEYEAWRRVVNELKNLGIDINAQDNLNGALVVWGDKLAELRAGQV